MTRRQWLYCGVVSVLTIIVALALSGCQTQSRAVDASAQEHVDDSLDRLLDELMETDARESAERMNRMVWLRNLLADRRDYDRGITQKYDLPEDILAQTPTDELFRHYMESGYMSLIVIYTGPATAIGVQRLLNASSNVHELYIGCSISILS